MLKAPDIYEIILGVEYGQRVYWATTAKGEWEAHDVTDLAEELYLRALRCSKMPQEKAICKFSVVY
jgi:hypothetical protein